MSRHGKACAGNRQALTTTPRTIIKNKIKAPTVLFALFKRPQTAPLECLQPQRPSPLSPPPPVSQEVWVPPRGKAIAAHPSSMHMLGDCPFSSPPNHCTTQPPGTEHMAHRRWDAHLGADAASVIQQRVPLQRSGRRKQILSCSQHALRVHLRHDVDGSPLGAWVGAIRGWDCRALIKAHHGLGLLGSIQLLAPCAPRSARHLLGCTDPLERL